MNPVPTSVLDLLAQLLGLEETCLGQVRLRPDFSLGHIEDANRSDLEIFSDPYAAIEIAKYDDAGKYRPLKTAPDLKRGWLLRLASLPDMCLALDFLYPAALGTLLAYRQKGLTPLGLRETLSRQTGMYAVTKKITDAQAHAVIAQLCQGGCLRHRLWTVSLSSVSPVIGKRVEGNQIPILCAEACNLFVAGCRKVVKGDQSSSGSM